MAMETETLEEKLVKLSRVCGRISTVATEAACNLKNAKPEDSLEVAQEIDDFLTRSGALQMKLGVLGRR